MAVPDTISAKQLSDFPMKFYHHLLKNLLLSVFEGGYAGNSVDKNTVGETFDVSIFYS
jgi:hypothetical protein